MFKLQSKPLSRSTLAGAAAAGRAALPLDAAAGAAALERLAGWGGGSLAQVDGGGWRHSEDKWFGSKNHTQNT